MRLHLADCPLKHLMYLLAVETPMLIRELGDTWHPSSGYVDEGLVAGVTTVGQLQAHCYNFEGLMFFEADVAEVLVGYHLEQYELSGPTKAIRKLESRLAELNANPAFQPKLQVLARLPD